MVDVKICRTCKKQKRISSFPKCGNLYIRPHCKPCYNRIQAAWRDKNRERIREKWGQASKKYYTSEKRRNKTLRAYGLTEEVYNALYDKQSGKCAICKTNTTLVVDHCHSSREIRGLLCNACNVGLGAFRDSPNLLKSAIDYLKVVAGSGNCIH